MRYDLTMPVATFKGRSRFAQERADIRGRIAGLFADHPLPPSPTKAAPGSDEKIRVMAKRVEAGYAPFHPDDLSETGR